MRLQKVQIVRSHKETKILQNTHLILTAHGVSVDAFQQVRIEQENREGRGGRNYRKAIHISFPLLHQSYESFLDVDWL